MVKNYDEVCTALKANPKSWLVTGAAGFIGSHLVEQLLRLGQQVKGVDNFSTGKKENLEKLKLNLGGGASEIAFTEGDISDSKLCEVITRDIDFVLHQAALGSVPRSIKDPVSSNRANVDGFLELFVAASAAKVRRFVYASSSSVYGDHEALPKVEDAIGSPLSPYAVTKRVDEMYAEVLSQTHGLTAAGLRYFNVFGPRQDPEGAYAAVIPRWIDAMKRGVQCEVYGDGETSRDFCYVENVVQANILAAVGELKNSHEVFNIACGGRLTLNDLYGHLREGVLLVITDAKVPAKPVYKEFRAGDVRHSHANIDKAKEILGYDVRVGVKEGIDRTVRWFLA